MKVGFKLVLNSHDAKTERASIIVVKAVSKLFRNVEATPELTTHVAFKSFISQVRKTIKH